MNSHLKELEERISYEFKNKNLFTQALTHSSYANERHWDKKRCNERLEFLGDAVLEVVSSEFLFLNHPDMPEGEMTKLRASLVCEPALAYCAEAISLGDYLILGKGEDMTGGRKRPSVVSDAMEAVIGAIYLDQGYRACYRFIDHVIIKRYIDLDNIARKEVNFKSSLIEWSQKNKLEVTFDLIESFSDNDGNPVFQTGVTLSDMQIGVGIGYSKKESQQNAAKMAIKKLRTDKAFQQFISELKKKQTGENTAEHEFEDLPEEEPSSEQNSIELTTNKRTECIDATINEEAR